MAPGCAGFPRLFDYVLLFQQSDFHHEPQPAYEQVRGEIATLLTQQAAAARDQGMSEEDVQEARFAVVAWADEMILQQTDWVHHQRWQSTPLQLEYCDTRNAGEELCERLERLRPEQSAVREIFYCCLGLGFRGCYCLGREDELRLAQIRHTQAQRLAHPVEPVPAIMMLMPQPYQIPPPGGRPITPPLTQRLLKASMALLAVVPLTCLVAYTAFPDHGVRPQPPHSPRYSRPWPPIQANLQAALRTLSHAPALAQPGTRRRYALPWYVLLGASASGKTTLLQSVAHDVPPLVQPDLTSAGATQTCDWWFFNSAIVLDTTGSMPALPAPPMAWRSGTTSAPAAALSPPATDQWPAVDDRRGYPGRAVRGRPCVRKPQFRQRLDEAQRSTDFPVYVLVTRCDLIAGFTEFFGSWPAHTVRQVFGYAHADRPPATPGCATVFAALLERLQHPGWRS